MDETLWTCLLRKYSKTAENNSALTKYFKTKVDKMEQNGKC